MTDNDISYNNVDLSLTQPGIQTVDTLDALTVDDLGFDISHYNGTITQAEFQLAHDAGYRFVYIKASEAVAFVDQRFSSNWVTALRAHLRRGAYHFFRPDMRGTGIAQAEHFIATVNKYGDGSLGELELCVDVEDPNVNNQLVDRETYRSSIETDLQLCIERLTALVGADKLSVYTRASYADDLLSHSHYLSAIKLWCANYPFVYNIASKPRLPKLWAHAKYWQFDNARQKYSEQVPGVGPADRDRFLG